MDFSKFAEDLRKITYANTYNNPIQNQIIRAAEKVLVRSKLVKRFFDLSEMIENGMEVDKAALAAFGLKVEVKKGSIENIPKNGPVLVVGNHPFGIVDGMVVASVLRGYRRDVKALAHQGISNLPQFAEYFLPINFDNSDIARQTNKKSTSDFKEHLRNGGLGILFPAGAVSTKFPIWRKNADPPWHPAAAKWARENNCQVVPVFIDGRCSMVFQVVSQFSMTLRLSALLYENTKMIDSEIGLRIGEAIDLATMPADWDGPKMVQYFREKTYELAGLDPQGRKIRKSKVRRV